MSQAGSAEHKTKVTSYLCGYAGRYVLLVLMICEKHVSDYKSSEL